MQKEIHELRTITFEVTDGQYRDLEEYAKKNYYGDVRKLLRFRIVPEFIEKIMMENRERWKREVQEQFLAGISAVAQENKTNVIDVIYKVFSNNYKNC
jgi:hypothetical protein